MSQNFEFRTGSLPLLISIPHAGTAIPDDIAESMTETARKKPDTDWFLDRLYDFFEVENASLIAANVSRYVIDLNRSTEEQNLYPGQNTTGLCPQTNFDGTPVYTVGNEPDDAEIKRRIEYYWRPYHKQLHSEIDRLVDKHGKAVLFDAHSIAAEIPNLFPGRLPDLNFGTNNGHSCGNAFQTLIDQFAESGKGYTQVVNGRFIGGYITRNYGDPKRNVHALQLELSQSTYTSVGSAGENPTWNQFKADQLQELLRSLFQSIIGWVSQS